MKLKITIALFAAAISFQSCTKCETCVAYRYYPGGIYGAPDKEFQSIKLCDHQDISNYENTNFSDPSTTDTVRFICK